MITDIDIKYTYIFMCICLDIHIKHVSFHVVIILQQKLIPLPHIQYFPSQLVVIFRQDTILSTGQIFPFRCSPQLGTQPNLTQHKRYQIPFYLSLRENMFVWPLNKNEPMYTTDPCFLPFDSLRLFKNNLNSHWYLGIISPLHREML